LLSDIVLAVPNDCSAGALGEYGFGWKPGDVRDLPKTHSRRPGVFRIMKKQQLPERFDRVCYLTISTGENGGFVDRGEVVGRPELGHGIYEKKDFFGSPAVCGCGGAGHLEALHSGTGLGRMILRGYNNGNIVRESRLYELIKQRYGTVPDGQLIKEIPVMLYEAARRHDPLALEISDWHNEITCGLICNILASGRQSQIIAIGGSVTRSMDYSMIPAFWKFSDSVEDGSNDYTGNQPVDQLPVLAVCKGYGEDHVLLGAGAAVFNKLYGGDV
jgi:hypothetical protein